jgi:hypothetical protein
MWPCVSAVRRPTARLAHERRTRVRTADQDAAAQQQHMQGLDVIQLLWRLLAPLLLWSAAAVVAGGGVPRHIRHGTRSKARLATAIAGVMVVQLLLCGAVTGLQLSYTGLRPAAGGM